MELHSFGFDNWHLNSSYPRKLEDGEFLLMVFGQVDQSPGISSTIRSFSDALMSMVLLFVKDCIHGCYDIIR